MPDFEIHSVKLHGGDGESSAEFGIVRDVDSLIRAKKWLSPDDEPESYCELAGLCRDDGTACAKLSTVCDAIRGVWPFYELMANGRPILTQCSARHARFYMAFLPRLGLSVSVLRGSLRADNPYPPLDITERGWTDDEHILEMRAGD